MEINFSERQFKFLCWLLSHLEDNATMDDETRNEFHDLINKINSTIEINEIINGHPFLDNT